MTLFLRLETTATIIAKIGAGFGDFNAADDIGINFILCGKNAAVPRQDRQQHRQTILIKTDRQTSWIPILAVGHQRLYFHQQRPCTFPQHGNHATRRGFFRAVQETSRMDSLLL